jgi:hypothetical protein
MKRIKRLPPDVNAKDFVPTVDEDLTMIWRELENLKRSIKPAGTTTINNVTNVSGGLRFVATDITISDTQETSITHGLGVVPASIIVVPRLTHKTVHREWVNASKDTNITVNHGLNFPVGTGSQFAQVTLSSNNPSTKAYVPFIGDSGDPNTWTFQYSRDATGICTGWLTIRREPPTWWTTRPSDSTNVYLRASQTFTATVIVEE